MKERIVIDKFKTFHLKKNAMVHCPILCTMCNTFYAEWNSLFISLVIID